MDELKSISRRLTLSNLIVFVLVLGIFGISVYAYWSNQIADQEKTAISRLTDSVIASIDFDRNDEGLPDLIRTTLPETQSTALDSLRLQYFTPDGKLQTERGHLSINLPFTAENSLRSQDTPHALVQTKSASHEGQLLGFVRVATPLADSDKMKQTLLSGLLLGLLVSLIGACLGTIWLVRLSLQPIQLQISRLERFTADAAHELRNPIAIVRTNSEVALKYPEHTNKNDIQKFETILDASKQMQSLTEDLLALARGQTAEASSEKNTYRLIDLANEAVNSVSAEQAYSQTKFEIDQNVSENLMVAGKRDELLRIMRNIFENAAHYGKPDGTVEISASSNIDSVSLLIRDYGVGISPADLPHIFERFWRADQARHHRSGGSGLGLSIASNLARQNNCAIEAASEPGKGSTFTIKFRRQ